MSETNTITKYPHQDGDGEVTSEQLAQHMSEHPELYHPDLIKHAERITGIASTAGQLMSEVVERPDEVIETDTKGLEDIRREDIARLIKITDYLRREVEKDYSRRDYAVEDVESYLNLSPEEVRRMREDSPYQYRGYADLIKDIRDMRRGQSEYIRLRMSELPESVSVEERRAALVDALSYSPVLGARALGQIKKHDTFNISNPLLTPEEVLAAAETKESFEETLSNLLTTQPDIVLSQYPLLKQIVEPKFLKEALYKTLQVAPRSIEQADGLNYVLKNIFETEEEAKLFLTASMQVIENIKISVIVDKRLRVYFGEEELKGLVDELVRSGNFGLMNEDLFTEGIVSEQQLLQILDTADKRYTYNGSENSKYLYAASNERHGKLSELPEAVKQRGKEKLLEYLSSDDRSAYESFRILEYGVFSSEEVSDLVRQLYKEKPSETLHQILQNGKLDKFFNQEEIPVILREYLSSTSPDTSGYSDILIIISRSGFLGQEEIKKYLDSLSGGLLLKIGPKLGEVGIYEEEEIRTRVLGEYQSLSPDSRYLYLQDVAVFMSDIELQAEINLIYSAGIVLGSYFMQRENIKEKLGDLDINALNSGLLDRIIAGDHDGANIADLLEGIERFQGISFAKQAAARLEALPAGKIFTAIERLDRLFDSNLIRSTVDKLMTEDSGVIDLISKLVYSGGGSWVRYVQPEKVKNLLLNAPSSALSLIVVNMQACLGYISEEEFNGISLRYIDEDPAEALINLGMINREGSDISEAMIAESVSRSRGILAADKYLQATISRALALDKEGSKKILLKEASVVYKSLIELDRQGLIDTSKLITEQESLTGPESLALVESMAVLTKLAGPEVARAVKSSIEVNKALANAIYMIAGVDQTPEIEPTRLEAVGGEIRVLATYITRHKESKGHVNLTKEMLDGLMSGNYRNWKFGDGSDSSLQYMKDKGLYPQGLSSEQLQTWSMDDLSQVSEVFSVEADVAAKTLVNILRNNQQFFDGAIEETQSVKTEISEIGRLIAEVEKEKQALKNSENSSPVDAQINELQERAVSLRTELIRLQLIDDLQSLMGLEADNIRSGTLLQQDGTKGRSIDSILQRLRKNAPKAAYDVIDQVQLALDGFRSQTGEVVNMVVADDSELMTTMRVGVEPVGSCQNYRTGELNEALYGYTDANTKILVLKTEKGSPVGRAIFRLLSDENGNPALHVDTIYSTDISDGARRAIYAHAIKKAEAMGVPVYVSELSQNEEGLNQGIRPIPGINLERNLSIISSNSSRAPYVYVDAGGGVKKRGVYSLRGLKQITLA